ncbi:MAG: hypothetical protein IJQ10_04100 [Clostridia bacterium]|nr:hypothetical protein [Clostridia bacterium]
MNKNKKKALAVLLGLISMGKNMSGVVQYASAKANDYSEYFKWGGISTAGAAAILFPILYFNLRGKKDAVKTDEKEFKNVNYPFKGVIPFYQWQNGNCFFLASLYTLFGPENMKTYEEVAKMQTSEVTNKFLDYLSKKGIDAGCQCMRPVYRKENVKGEIKEVETGELRFVEDNFNQDVIDNKKKSNGFIELCKLFVRQQEALKSNPDSRFQIIPSDFKGEEIAFEQKICHGEKLLDRDGGAGAFYEVLSKFTGTSPFVHAFGDKSLFAAWSSTGGSILNPVNEEVRKLNEQNSRNLLKNNTIWKFNQINDIKIEGLGSKNIPPCSMDENGKVKINGENYYLVSMAQTQGSGEGHIICDQPKYKIIDGEIKVSGLLKLSCFGSAPKFKKYDNMTGIFKSYDLKTGVKYYIKHNETTKKDELAYDVTGAVGFAFRFAPEKAIREYQDYYCYNN